jgi:hypothetical protein
MATLPGLPMVGHGQVEGYSEKYGMEYHRAKWQEHPDQELISRHQSQIFPLFHQRRLFAGVENFLLYDFYSGSGNVNEDVFAFSNRLGEQSGLVIYHNRFGDTRGWIKTSAAFKAEGNDQLVQQSLGDGLSLPNDPNAYVIFRNLVTNKEYIRNCAEVFDKGLFLELFAYQTYVFLDFRVIYDDPDGRYSRVNAFLGGQPVDNVDEALQEMFLQVIHHPYRELINAGMLRFLISERRDDFIPMINQLPLEQVSQKSNRLLRAVSDFLGADPKIEPIAELIRSRTDKILDLPILAERYPYPRSRKYPLLVDRIQKKIGQDFFNWTALLITALTQPVGMIRNEETRQAAQNSRDWIDEWLLRKVIREAFKELPLSQAAAQYGINLTRLLVGHFGWNRIEGGKTVKPRRVLASWLNDPVVRNFLKINTFEEIEWFNGEAMATWLDWMLIIGVLDVLTNPEIEAGERTREAVKVYDWINKIEKAVDKAEYQIGVLVKGL